MKEFEELYFGQGLYIGLSGSMFYPPKLAEHYTEPEQQLFLNLLEFRRVVAVLKKIERKGFKYSREYIKETSDIFA